MLQEVFGKVALYNISRRYDWLQTGLNFLDLEECSVCVELVNPFTPDSAKSKIDKCSKITNWVKNWVLSLESNVRKLCISQGLTL